MLPLLSQETSPSRECCTKGIALPPRSKPLTSPSYFPYVLLLLLLQATSRSRVSHTKALHQPSSKQQWQTYHHILAAASAASLLLH
jgi:hypothetical protein